MDNNEIERINQFLYEFEEIPSDAESVLSEDAEIEDHELNIDTTDNYDFQNLINFPIEFEDGIVIDDMLNIFNEANDDMLDDETNETDDINLASRIHKEGIEWNNYFRYAEKNYLFCEPVGPTQSVINNLEDPYSSFQQIFSLELIDHLVYQTNLYIMQEAGVNNKPITLDEMKKFLGINILMGIKRLPSYRDYWCSIEEIRDFYISKIMPVNRFGYLLSHLHINDNTNMKSHSEPGYDKLFKVRPLLDNLSRTFKFCYNPTRIQSIDESMIAFKGRSSFKQYMPNKPTKRGYKVWTRADALGYVCQFEIYTGKVKNIIEKNLGSRVVKSLINELIGKNYMVYFDNYFSSAKLMADLMENNVLACATTRINRIDFPKCFADDKELSRGQYEWRATVTGIVAMKWKDNKGIHFLSNFHDPTQSTQMNRKLKDGQVNIINCSQLVKDYNENMGYVDKADMMMSTYKIDRKSKKWYMRIFFHFLDLAVHNAFILFTANSEGKQISLKHFRLAVAIALIGSINQSKSPRGGQKKKLKQHTTFKPKVLYEKRFNSCDHMPVRKNSRRCANCSTKSQPHRSKWSCSICDVGLCLNEEKNCFKDYHEK